MQNVDQGFGADRDTDRGSCGDLPAVPGDHVAIDEPGATTRIILL